MVMAEDDIREILNKVSRGELSPEEGAAQVEALQQRQLAVTASPIRRVRVVGALHPLRVVGDADVREAAVTGPHQVKREGETLEIRTGARDDQGSGFSFHWPGQIGIPGFPSGHPERALRPIQIRLNPELALEVEMAAGLLSVKDVRSPIRAEIQAGSAKVEGFASPIELRVTWGAISAQGVLKEGKSTIRSEAGTVRVGLERGSSVRVLARSTMGRINLPGDTAGLAEGWTMGGEERQARVGEGEGELEVETTAGVVWVEEL